MAETRITPPGPLPPPIIGTDPASAPGIPQPVIVAGGQSLPPSLPEGADDFTSAGWGWLPPPQVGMGENEPFPTPVVPPGVMSPWPTTQPPLPDQPQFATGDIATPPTMFPGWTLTVPPSPPIVFANIFMNGAGNPPTTPTTAVIPWTGAITPTLDEPEPQALSADVAPKPRRSHRRKR